jgi:hypothetical protein
MQSDHALSSPNLQINEHPFVNNILPTSNINIQHLQVYMIRINTLFIQHYLLHIYQNIFNLHIFLFYFPI